MFYKFTLICKRQGRTVNVVSELIEASSQEQAHKRSKARHTVGVDEWIFKASQLFVPLFPASLKVNPDYSVVYK